MNMVALDGHSEEARIRPVTRAARPDRDHDHAARGYFAHGRAAADYRPGDVVALPVDPPQRSLIATVCVHNLGAPGVSLAAVVDRRRSRSAVFVNGVAVAAGLRAPVRRARPVSILERLPDSVQRMSVLRPAACPSRRALAAAGAVRGRRSRSLALWAFARALRDDDAEMNRPERS